MVVLTGKAVTASALSIPHKPKQTTPSLYLKNEHDHQINHASQDLSVLFCGTTTLSKMQSILANSLSTSLFVIGIMAFYNSLQCFIPSWTVSKRIYSKSQNQVTPLASRLMGTWTLTSSIIRIYASYHINESAAYDLALASFGIAFASFMSEVFVYKTASVYSPGVWPALLVSSSHIIWMVSFRAAYV